MLLRPKLMTRDVLAIHDREGSFSDEWIKYCHKRGIAYKRVNCYEPDIVEQVRNCKGLMWHWAHNDYRARLFARQLTRSLESGGYQVFPDTRTSWHYDDKLGQKYLLESIRAPVVKSYVFYDRDSALAWVDATNFPKVFKMRTGAGSQNVALVATKHQAKRLIRRAFGNGFAPRPRTSSLKEHVWHLRRDLSKEALVGVGRGVARLFVRTEMERNTDRERGYVYFQDFIPGNDHDIRVIVIGDRAFAIRRAVRKDDFRASGSGVITYDPAEIPLSCVESAYKWARELRAQCVAFDFLMQGKNPMIVEISYSFTRKVYRPCPGFWDDDIRWHQGHFIPEHFMIEQFLAEITRESGQPKAL